MLTILLHTCCCLTPASPVAAAGWEDYGEFASQRQAVDDFVGPPRPMRMGFTSDAESDIEVSSTALRF